MRFWRRDEGRPWTTGKLAGEEVVSGFNPCRMIRAVELKDREPGRFLAVHAMLAEQKCKFETVDGLFAEKFSHPCLYLRSLRTLREILSLRPRLKLEVPQNQWGC